MTITLPLASSVSEGRLFYIIDEGGNASVNNITINASGGNLVVGNSNIVINLNYMALTIYSDGTSNWFLL